jgi:hypothetical protein
VCLHAYFCRRLQLLASLVLAGVVTRLLLLLLVLLVLLPHLQQVCNASDIVAAVHASRRRIAVLSSAARSTAVPEEPPRAHSPLHHPEIANGCVVNIPRANLPIPRPQRSSSGRIVVEEAAVAAAPVAVWKQAPAIRPVKVRSRKKGRVSIKNKVM